MVAAAAAEEEQKAVPDLVFYSFPTLEQLSAASEAALRAEGFGYRYHQTTLHCMSAGLLCFDNTKVQPPVSARNLQDY